MDQLTSPNSIGEADTPGRLLALGSSRGRYWNEGMTVGEHALLKGAGAGGFAIAHSRYYRSGPNLFVTHSHSYLVETFADLGLIGVALSLALLVAWAAAAARATGLQRRGPPTGSSAERIGLITLLTTVIMFGLGSAIDWTWFIPGVALPALVCAGWLAGRGPLARTGAPPRFRRPAPGAIFAVTAIATIALVTAWLMAQPLRSADADAAGLTAITKGDTATAFADARAAHSEDPESVDPLFELSAFDRVTGDDRAALDELRSAVSLQPDNPATWLQEGELLVELGRPAQALPLLARAAKLDLGSIAAASAIVRARAELGQATPTGSRSTRDSGSAPGPCASPHGSQQILVLVGDRLPGVVPRSRLGPFAVGRDERRGRSAAARAALPDRRRRRALRSRCRHRRLSRRSGGGR